MAEKSILSLARLAELANDEASNVEADLQRQRIKPALTVDGRNYYPASALAKLHNWKATSDEQND